MKRWVLFSACFAVTLSVAAASRLPADVQAFARDRDGCDHFRGEPFESGNEPTARQRREFIEKSVRKFCTGTDRRLKNLRAKYQRNPAVLERLHDYEDQIE